MPSFLRCLYVLQLHSEMPTRRLVARTQRPQSEKYWIVFHWSDAARSTYSTVKLAWPCSVAVITWDSDVIFPRPRFDSWQGLTFLLFGCSLIIVNETVRSMASLVLVTFRQGQRHDTMAHCLHHLEFSNGW
jgi:hypothetical protein